MLVRDAQDGDLDAVLAIYNDQILHGTALWSDDPVPRSDREAWLEHHRSHGFAVLVAEVDGEVAGYASYDQWRARSGYRHCVEDSVYLREQFQGQGIGRALLTAVIGHARAAGHHVMLADIESGNAASLALHRALGFEDLGRLPEIGTKFGSWLDLSILGLRLD